MRSIAFTCLTVFAVTAAQAQNTTAAKLTWGPAPAVFPKGAQMAVVSGDPGAAAPFVVQLSMPDGYRIPPHFHPTDEQVTVKKGTFLVGMGDAFDAAKAKPLKVGEKGQVPAKMHHYGAAKGATIVEVSAMGPFAMTYVNSADDPQKQPAKP
ncbi:MAG: cupin domain-containing protein [Gemmatimonadota bacterium]